MSDDDFEECTYCEEARGIIGDKGRTPICQSCSHNRALIERLRARVAELAKRRLRLIMSDVSEETWHACWLTELEFVLWLAVKSNDGVSFEQRDIDEMRLLSQEAGGWWTYEKFLPMDEWEQKFAEWEWKR